MALSISANHIGRHKTMNCCKFEQTLHNLQRPLFGMQTDNSASDGGSGCSNEPHLIDKCLFCVDIDGFPQTCTKRDSLITCMSMPTVSLIACDIRRSPHVGHQVGGCACIFMARQARSSQVSIVNTHPSLLLGAQCHWELT